MQLNAKYQFQAERKDANEGALSIENWSLGTLDRQDSTWKSSGQFSAKSPIGQLISCLRKDGKPVRKELQKS